MNISCSLSSEVSGWQSQEPGPDPAPPLPHAGGDRDARSGLRPGVGVSSPLLLRTAWPLAATSFLAGLPRAEGKQRPALAVPRPLAAAAAGLCRGAHGAEGRSWPRCPGPARGSSPLSGSWCRGGGAEGAGTVCGCLEKWSFFPCQQAGLPSPRSSSSSSSRAIAPAPRVLPVPSSPAALCRASHLSIPGRCH